MPSSSSISEHLLHRLHALRGRLRVDERIDVDQVNDTRHRLMTSRQRLRQTEDELKRLIVEVKRLELACDRYEMVQDSGYSQALLLSDLEGLLKGELFQASNEGAHFFTQSLIDFADQQQIGEMTLEACIQASAEPMMITLKGRTYCYLKTSNGSYYFHPNQLDKERFLQV